MEKEKQQINSTHPFMRNDGDYRKLRYGHAVIYRPDEWFFVHIPKNGGTSFASHAKKFRENYKKLGVHLLYIDFNELHNQADILQEKYKEVLINCTPVCLTRNPWSRCLSLYMFNLQAAVRPLNIREEWAMHVHSRLSREGFKKAWKEESEGLMSALSAALDRFDDNSSETLKTEFSQWIEERGFGFGKVMMPLRLALVGALEGADVFDIIHCIGKAEAIFRIKALIDKA